MRLQQKGRARPEDDPRYHFAHALPTEVGVDGGGGRPGCWEGGHLMIAAVENDEAGAAGAAESASCWGSGKRGGSYLESSLQW